jgi:hypothetical protein
MKRHGPSERELTMTAAPRAGPRGSWLEMMPASVRPCWSLLAMPWRWSREWLCAWRWACCDEPDCCLWCFRRFWSSSWIGREGSWRPTIRTIGLSASNDHHIGRHRSFTRGATEILPSAAPFITAVSYATDSPSKNHFLLSSTAIPLFPHALAAANLDGNGRALSFVDLRRRNHWRSTVWTTSKRTTGVVSNRLVGRTL